MSTEWIVTSYKNIVKLKIAVQSEKKNTRNNISFMIKNKYN